jgi:hypothetical protein
MSINYAGYFFKATGGPATRFALRVTFTSTRSSEPDVFFKIFTAISSWS